VGKYEQLAIELLVGAFDDRFVRDDTRVFSFGLGAGTGEVDGTIDEWIAVEIGVGSSKQIRASVLDLALHPYRGKLLILVDTPGHSTERSVDQAEAILERLGYSGVVFRVGEVGEGRQVAAELAQLVSEYTEGGDETKL
jgi:hypothetical protein